MTAARATMPATERQRSQKPNTSPRRPAAKRRPDWIVRARVAAAFRALCHGVDAGTAYQRTRGWWRARGALAEG